MSYLLLALSAFISATLLPFSSEAFLLVLLGTDHDPYLLLLAATTGNTLGGFTSWILGRFLLRFSNRRWFYFSQHQLDRGQQLFTRFGLWSLLLTWLPIVGDLLCVAAGTLKVKWYVFVPLVALGKALRYIALISIF